MPRPKHRHRALLIEQMKFTIAKLRHEKFGQSSERGALLEQLKLGLADMEEDASEAEARAQMAAAAAAHAGVQVQGCKIACNIDPLRGLFAPNSDPL
jgi:transposase